MSDADTKLSKKYHNRRSLRLLAYLAPVGLFVWGFMYFVAGFNCDIYLTNRCYSPLVKYIPFKIVDGINETSLGHYSSFTNFQYNHNRSSCIMMSASNTTYVT